MSDIDFAVDEFASALKRRLRHRAMQGKAGWNCPSWEQECLSKMEASAREADPLDTAGYACFAHYHGWGKQ